MLIYADRQRLIKSLGLTYKSFGFINSSDKKTLNEICLAFNEWDRDNSYKYEQSLQQFTDVRSVLSRSIIYEILKENILKLRTLENESITFENFFKLVFVKSFKIWQVEYDKNKKEASMMILDREVKKYHRRMKMMKPSK
jgi:hypothetical protein